MGETWAMAPQSTQHANRTMTQGDLNSDLYAGTRPCIGLVARRVRSIELCTATESNTTLSNRASSDEQDLTYPQGADVFPVYDEAFAENELASDIGTQGSPAAKEVIEEGNNVEEPFKERLNAHNHCTNISAGHDSQLNDFIVVQILHKQHSINDPNQQYSLAEEEVAKRAKPTPEMAIKDHITEDTELQYLPATEKPIISNNTVEQIVRELRSVDEDDRQSFQVTEQTPEDSHEDAVQANDNSEDSSRTVEGGETSENGRIEEDSMADEARPGLTPRFLTKRYSTLGSGEPAAIQQLMNMIDSFDFGTPEGQAALGPVEQSLSISDSRENDYLFGDSCLGSSVEDMRSFDDDLKQHWMFGDHIKVKHNEVVPSSERKLERIEVVPPSEGEVEKSTGTRNSIQQPLERDSSILPILSEDELTYPEGGLRAWLVIFGCWCGMFASLGLISTLGSFQTYYLENTLSANTPSQVGWIFSTFTFLTFGCSLYIGPLFDYYGPRLIIFIGSLLLTIMMFSLPYCKRKSSPTTGNQANNK
jgi:hypothetical protein